MKRINASVITVAVVLALIAFVAPSSAYLISSDDVVCDTMTTTWTFDVTCDTGEQDISNIIVAWCNRKAVTGVLVGNTDLTDFFNKGYDPGWDYVTQNGITGIKIDSAGLLLEGTTVRVEITLDNCYETSEGVEWEIKAGQEETGGSQLYGPSACTPIPEFSTIAIPIASILGLLFFFNHRKRRER